MVFPPPTQTFLSLHLHLVVIYTLNLQINFSKPWPLQQNDALKYDLLIESCTFDARK